MCIYLNHFETQINCHNYIIFNDKGEKNNVYLKIMICIITNMKEINSFVNSAGFFIFLFCPLQFIANINNNSINVINFILLLSVSNIRKETSFTQVKD